MVTSIFFLLSKSMWTSNCLVTQIHQNIFCSSYINTFIITHSHIVFKLGSVIYSNVLKEVSSQQGCIYLYRKNTCLIQEGGPKSVLCWYRMSDRMLKNVAYIFFNLTVKSTFWLFNLCNAEKNWQTRPTWGKQCKTLRPRVSFCSASASAKKCHFGASLRCTGIKFYSLGINTYCLQ